MLLLTLLAAVLRLYGLERLGLTHFDEGVYATSGMWSLDGRGASAFYPNQILFAPPLFPILTGISFRLTGAAADTAAIGVSVLASILTVPLTWWLARRWFSRPAALAAATLIAPNDYHILFSRTALTDATFGFLFLLALAAVSVALEKKTLPYWALAGLVVGAAWNTKYHGWLPAALACAVVAFMAMRRGSRPAKFWPLIYGCLLMALVAAACYLPWFLYISQSPGGYAGLNQFHSNFLTFRWMEGFQRHVEMQLYLDGWPSRLSIFLAALVAALWEGRTLLRDIRLVAVMLAFAAGGVVLGAAGAALLLAAGASRRIWRSGSPFGWLLLATLLLLFIVTPLYHPYARLLMPFLLCAQVAAGAAITALLKDNRATADARPRVFLLPLLVGGVLLAALTATGFRPQPRIWTAEDSLRRGVKQMAAALPKDCVVWTYAEPEVTFYLRALGYAAIPYDFPGDPSVVTRHVRPGGRPHFIVTGVYSERNEQARKSMPQPPFTLVRMGSWPVDPGEVRLLDDVSPAAARMFRAQPTDAYHLHLYRVVPPAPLAGAEEKHLP